MSLRAFLGLVDNLQSAVERLKWRAEGTEWADYYDGTNYTDAAMRDKQAIVAEYLDEFILVRLVIRHWSLLDATSLAL